MPFCVRGSIKHYMNKFMRSKRILSFLYVSFIVIIINTSICSAQSLTIDLVNGQINNTQLCGLALDDLTNMLGRPSAVNDNKLVASMVGVQLSYHPLGLHFWFKPESQDPKKGCWLMTIYLTKTWDKEYNEFFMPYNEKVSQDINAQWKASQVENEYKDYKISIRTAEEHEKQLESALGSSEFNANHPYSVNVNFGAHKANFNHENTTKFLESVSIVCNSMPRLKAD